MKRGNVKISMEFFLKIITLLQWNIKSKMYGLFSFAVTLP